MDIFYSVPPQKMIIYKGVIRSFLRYRSENDLLSLIQKPLT